MIFQFYLNSIESNSSSYMWLCVVFHVHDTHEWWQCTLLMTLATGRSNHMKHGENITKVTRIIRTYICDYWSVLACAVYFCVIRFTYHLRLNSLSYVYILIVNDFINSPSAFQTLSIIWNLNILCRLRITCSPTRYKGNFIHFSFVCFFALFCFSKEKRNVPQKRSILLG